MATPADRLQDFVKHKFKTELKLILDCKTRWKSLLAMLERFLKLKECISKTFRVIASEESVSEEEWNTIKIWLKLFALLKLYQNLFHLKMPICSKLTYL